MCSVQKLDFVLDSEDRRHSYDIPRSVIKKNKNYTGMQLQNSFTADIVLQIALEPTLYFENHLAVLRFLTYTEFKKIHIPVDKDG